MTLRIYTAPAAEPVSLAEAKQHLKLSGTADDTLLTRRIKAATSACEEYARRAFVTQTWDLAFDGRPDGRELQLLRPPLVSVTSVTAYDTAGAAATVSAADYEVDLFAGRILLKESADWPTSLRPTNGLIVRYVAGYGAAAAVPEAIKYAIEETVRAWYDLDEAGSIEERLRLPVLARAALKPYRVVMM